MCVCRLCFSLLPQRGAARCSRLCVTTARWKTSLWKVSLCSHQSRVKAEDALIGCSFRAPLPMCVCVSQLKARCSRWSWCLCQARRSLLWWERCTTSLQSTSSVLAPATLTLCNRRKSSLGTMCKSHYIVYEHYAAWNSRTKQVQCLQNLIQLSSG